MHELRVVVEGKFVVDTQPEIEIQNLFMSFPVVQARQLLVIIPTGLMALDGLK